MSPLFARLTTTNSRATTCCRRRRRRRLVADDAPPSHQQNISSFGCVGRSFRWRALRAGRRSLGRRGEGSGGRTDGRTDGRIAVCPALLAVPGGQPAEAASDGEVSKRLLSSVRASRPCADGRAAAHVSAAGVRLLLGRSRSRSVVYARSIEERHASRLTGKAGTRQRQFNTLRG